jgi:exodeoxyribonuclease VII small subunit
MPGPLLSHEPCAQPFTFFHLPMPKPSTAAQPLDAAAPANYEVALQELEALIARMDAGELPLDDLLVSYQRGAVLLQFCRDKLQAVEDQVKVLEDGVLKPWKTS